MKELKKIDKPTYYYLIEADVRKWSRTYSLVWRYLMMTSNIVLLINSTLRHARKLPVITLVKFILNLMQTWFYDWKNVAERKNNILTSAALLHVRKNSNVAQYLIVKLVDHVIYEVKDRLKDHVVDLINRTCTCHMFQIDLLPCSHACTIIRYVLYFIDFQVLGCKIDNHV